MLNEFSAENKSNELDVKFITKSNEITKTLNDELDKKIKEVDTLVDDLKSDYDSLEKIIIDENASANLQNQINDTSSQLAHIEKNVLNISKY